MQVHHPGFAEVVARLGGFPNEIDSSGMTGLSVARRRRESARSRSFRLSGLLDEAFEEPSSSGKKTLLGVG